eukprot:m.360460 g.360460  ORF g.360460 m.360460 type:complete len:1084 (-) comp19057_c0_seq1:538-3789(-)
MWTRFLFVLLALMPTTAIAVRINCGGPSLRFNGQLWQADEYFVGGNESFAKPADIANVSSATPTQLYFSERFAESGSSTLRYVVPVSPGLYSIRLHFVELFYTVPHSRVFSVTVNNQTFARDLSIYAQVGLLHALVIERTVNVTEPASVEIQLDASAGESKINGIEVLLVGGLATTTAASTSTAFMLQPVLQVNCGGSSFASWITDADFVNQGEAFFNKVPIAGTMVQEVYQSERWDRKADPTLQYQIPLPAGEYLVQLMFAEIAISNAQVGARIFDVYLQGQLVLKGLDIFKRVGFATAYIAEWPLLLSGDSLLALELRRISGDPKINGIQVFSINADPTTSSSTAASPTTAPSNSTATLVTKATATTTLATTASTTTVSTEPTTSSTATKTPKTTTSITTTTITTTAATTTATTTTATTRTTTTTATTMSVATSSTTTASTASPTPTLTMTTTTLTMTATTLKMTTTSTDTSSTTSAATSLHDASEASTTTTSATTITGTPSTSTISDATSTADLPTTKTTQTYTASTTEQPFASTEVPSTELQTTVEASWSSTSWVTTAVVDSTFPSTLQTTERQTTATSTNAVPSSAASTATGVSPPTTPATKATTTGSTATTTGTQSSTTTILLSTNETSTQEVTGILRNPVYLGLAIALPACVLVFVVCLVLCCCPTKGCATRKNKHHLIEVSVLPKMGTLEVEKAHPWVHEGHSHGYALRVGGRGKFKLGRPLYFKCGETYEFHLLGVSVQYPLYITESAVGGEHTTAWVRGVRGSPAVGYDIMLFTVPYDAPQRLFYQCASLPSMGGVINVYSDDGDEPAVVSKRQQGAAYSWPTPTSRGDPNISAHSTIQHSYSVDAPGDEYAEDMITAILQPFRPGNGPSKHDQLRAPSRHTPARGSVTSASTFNSSFISSAQPTQPRQMHQPSPADLHVHAQPNPANVSMGSFRLNTTLPSDVTNATTFLYEPSLAHDASMVSRQSMPQSLNGTSRLGRGGNNSSLLLSPSSPTRTRPAYTPPPNYEGALYYAHSTDDEWDQSEFHLNSTQVRTPHRTLRSDTMAMSAMQKSTRRQILQLDDADDIVGEIHL